ncbi:DUF3971 domain-containing protein [Rhizobium skierniewicense]|uniref:YhdP family protein n=1 Tax=Rhizobium skierniewicense TaxID=984260 RepID=UPI001572D627|nr:DUF3971 domain-containing protein [Rhizobium skierniewicense]NTF31997.1 hypothetical protein [Rhizobium skierniewicense]
MAEIRGEKVSFNKRDIQPLHAMPSAQIEDPIIVHCPAPRSMMRSLLKVFAALFILAVISIGGIILSIETGSVDNALSTQAKQALEHALGSRYEARIGSTSVRFASGFQLALVAQDVDIIEQATGQHMSRARAIGMALDPLALLTGRVSVQSIEATGMELDTALLPKGQGIDMAKLRVDAVPDYLNMAFKALDTFAQTFKSSGTDEIDLSDISIRLPPKQDGGARTIVLQELSLVPDGEGGYALDGSVAFNGEVATLALAAKGANGGIDNFSARLDGFDIGPLVELHDPEGLMHQGLNVKAGLNILGSRERADAKPALSVSAGIGDGKLYIGGDAQPVTGGSINAHYDFDSNVIALENSGFTFGQSVLPLRANIKDNSEGFDLSLKLEGAQAVAEAGGEPPVPFDLTADGTFNKTTRRLDFPGLYVKSPLGDMAGSLKVTFGVGSPEISFGGQIAQMEATAVKQLWPFWMARKARPWVISNLYGGTVRNGSISVFIPQGKMCGPGCPMELSGDELQIKFDVENTRLSVAGDIPPLRDASAHFELKGETIDVDIIRAMSFSPSNRTVTLENSTFKIQSVYEKPLMADLDLNLSGAADAVAEMATFRPINALKDSEFKPGDFAGQVKANVKLTVGLLNSQNPPPPVWSAHLDLEDVALTRPFAGRTVTGVNGPLTIDQQALHLKGKGRIDDVAMDIDLVQPVGKSSTIARQLMLKATLESAQIAKLAPELRKVISGTALLEINGSDPKRQSVKLDLSNASLVLPGLGWTKGLGIPATASLAVEVVDGRTDISDFSLKGDGFGANGELSFDKSGLISANFSRFQLSPQDNFAVAVSSSRKNYTISANGKSIDLKPLIAKLRNPAPNGGGGGGGGSGSGDGDFGSFSITAQIDKVYGFNDEVMSNVDADINLRNGKLRTIDLKGVTSRGQALVAQTINRGDGGTINVTTSDAGSFVRFANLYSRLRGGLLNLALTTANGNDWSGSLDMRNFAVVNEAKLQDIVATPTGQDGRSLNTAVRRNIDVSSEKFQRGFARVVYVNGTLALENGVVRGEQIGATFQGIVKDQNGNMDMTGTFMPAYGLNRLFGELPFIGIFLGNGQDRGLLGITFKLTGQTDTPRLVINPLSLIAPGVFRQIFEF